MFSSSFHDRIQKAKPTEPIELPLAAGETAKDSLWDEIINLRLVTDSRYLRWKLRGGNSLLKDVTGNLLTIKPFTATVGTTTVRFVALHTDAGKVYLYNLDAYGSTASGSLNEIFTGMDTTGQIQLHQFGKFIYAFDYDGGAAKVYDIDTGQGSVFMQYAPSRITGSTWIENESTPPFEQENIFGFGAGARVLAFPYQDGTLGTEYIIGLTKGIMYADQAYYYQYNGGGFISIDGAEIKENRIFIFQSDKMFDINNTGTACSLKPIEISLDSAGKPDFTAYATKLTGFSYGVTGIEAEVAARMDGRSGTYSAGTPTNTDTYLLPGTEDLIAELQGHDSKYRYYGRQVEVNPYYIEPKIFKTYVVLDMLADGSYCIPGRPFTCSTTLEALADNRRRGIRLQLGQADVGVARRYLFATRWRSTMQATLTPSDENYTNGTFFLVAELDQKQTAYDDFTPDTQLLRPLSEKVPLTAGIPAIFGPGQLAPHSATSLKGTLMMGGYTINRPVPTPYSDADDTPNGNILVTQPSGGVAQGDRSIGIQFVYTDGSVSQLVSSLPSGTTIGLQFDNSDATTMLQVHSLNLLVAKVNIIGISGGNQYLLASFDTGSAEFCGSTWSVPVGNLDYSDSEYYYQPAGAREVTHVPLEDYVAIATPFQQFHIARQHANVDRSPILKAVPMSFASDKTVLRYKVAIFTTKNIQFGYLTDAGTESAPVYNADFEIVSEQLATRSRESITMLQDQVIFQATQSINSLRGDGQIAPMLDTRRYSTLTDNEITDILHNEAWRELWVLTRTNRVLVYDLVAGAWRQMDMDGPHGYTLRCGAFGHEMLLLGMDNHLCQGDQQDLQDDFGSGTPIEGTAITTHLAGMDRQLYLSEWTVYGDKLPAQISVDAGDQRHEGYAGATSDTFSSSWAAQQAPITPGGQAVFPGLRTIMPRIRLQVQAAAGGYVQNVRGRIITTENEGIARQ